MQEKNKINFEFGNNEETFEFFTRLAKKQKASVLKQSELLKDKNIEKLDITELHRIIDIAHNVEEI